MSLLTPNNEFFDDPFVVNRVKHAFQSEVQSLVEIIHLKLEKCLEKYSTCANKVLFIEALLRKLQHSVKIPPFSINNSFDDLTMTNEWKESAHSLSMLAVIASHLCSAVSHCLDRCDNVGLELKNTVNFVKDLSEKKSPNFTKDSRLKGMTSHLLNPSDSTSVNIGQNVQSSSGFLIGQRQKHDENHSNISKDSKVVPETRTSKWCIQPANRPVSSIKMTNRTPPYCDKPTLQGSNKIENRTVKANNYPKRVSTPNHNIKTFENHIKKKVSNVDHISSKPFSPINTNNSIQPIFNSLTTPASSVTDVNSHLHKTHFFLSNSSHSSSNHLTSSNNNEYLKNSENFHINDGISTNIPLLNANVPSDSNHDVDLLGVSFSIPAPLQLIENNDDDDDDNNKSCSLNTKFARLIHNKPSDHSNSPEYNNSLSNSTQSRKPEAFSKVQSIHNASTNTTNPHNYKEANNNNSSSNNKPSSSQHDHSEKFSSPNSTTCLPFSLPSKSLDFHFRKSSKEIPVLPVRPPIHLVLKGTLTNKRNLNSSGSKQSLKPSVSRDENGVFGRPAYISVGSDKEEDLEIEAVTTAGLTRDSCLHSPPHVRKLLSKSTTIHSPNKDQLKIGVSRRRVIRRTRDDGELNEEDTGGTEFNDSSNNSFCGVDPDAPLHVTSLNHRMESCAVNSEGVYYDWTGEASGAGDEEVAVGRESQLQNSVSSDFVDFPKNNKIESSHFNNNEPIYDNSSSSIKVSVLISSSSISSILSDQQQCSTNGQALTNPNQHNENVAINSIDDRFINNEDDTHLRNSNNTLTSTFSSTSSTKIPDQQCHGVSLDDIVKIRHQILLQKFKKSDESTEKEKRITNFKYANGENKWEIFKAAFSNPSVVATAKSSESEYLELKEELESDFGKSCSHESLSFDSSSHHSSTSLEKRSLLQLNKEINGQKDVIQTDNRPSFKFLSQLQTLMNTEMEN